MTKYGVVLLFFIVVQSAESAFLKIDEITLPNTNGGSGSGITFDGTNWHISNGWNNYFQSYNEDFVFLGNTTVASFYDIRGITFNANSGNLFMGGGISRQGIKEVTLAGVEIQEFEKTNTTNALAYDLLTDSLWIACYSGVIENRTLTGELITSFTYDYSWTGLAFDSINNTLLALEGDDTLFEISADGNLIEQIITIDQLPGNGFGIYYDSSTGTLYAISQENPLTVFRDAGRVPEPATLLLLGLGAVMVRRKR